MMVLVHVPWMTSRSCEWGENAFYKERSARHLAQSQVLGSLALHRWMSSMWPDTNKKRQKECKTKKVLHLHNAHMPFPALPAQFVDCDKKRGGHLWTRLQDLMKPLLEKHKMMLKKKTNVLGEGVWVVMVKEDGADIQTQAAAEAVAVGCIDSIGAGLRMVPGTILSDGNKMSQKQVPWAAVYGAQETNATHALCVQLACIMQSTAPTDLLLVYPEEATRTGNKHVEPSLVEDVVHAEVCVCLQMCNCACFIHVTTTIPHLATTFPHEVIT